MNSISRRMRLTHFLKDSAVSYALALLGLALLGAGLVGLENWRNDMLQSRRTVEQTRLLSEMDSIRNPIVSQIAADWRLVYSEPNDDRLAELRDLAAQVRTDPSALLPNVKMDLPQRIEDARKKVPQLAALQKSAAR